MRNCEICNHPMRIEIETALFKMCPENSESTLRAIVDKYDVSEEALQEHALFHTSFNCGPDGDSIVRQIKMREADLLASVALDQLSTVKVVGKRIRDLAVKDPEEGRFERTLSKSVVDLYVGAGDGVRRNVQTIADINQLLNGPKDDSLSGLAALAKVLDESRRGTTSTEVDSE